MELKIKEEPKTRKVMMLWTEQLYIDTKDLAVKYNMSVSELSRHALTKLILEEKLQQE